MRKALQSQIVAAVSFIVNYLFFFEYLPPFKRVHIPYDLDGFHFPLVDYAFRSLRQGRFPEWDPTIYCGLSFVGNIQAALFYPVTWVLFAANLGRERVLYVSLEVLVILHVWLAFLLCFLWLRWRGLELLPSVFGGTVFAYSGYMLLQLQHQGLVTGYAWMPLGLWAIDHAVKSQSWRPLWKLAAASALCLLAGYPPTWFVFAVCMGTYAFFQWRWKIVVGTALALVLSVSIASVQLFPTWEANKLKMPEMRYGTGIRNPNLYLSYLLPNYFDFGMQVDVATNPRGEYLYLGAPAMLGLACLLRRRALREQRAFLAMGAVTLIVLTNPFGLVWEVLKHSSVLGQICRDWYFLAGLTLTIAPLAAHGLNGFLKQKSRGAPRWLEILLPLMFVGWSVRQIVVWLPGGSEFGAGWRAALEPAVTLGLFAAGMYVFRSARNSVRAWLVIALLLMVIVDYKAFGTSKRFNGAEGRVDPPYRYRKFPGMEDVLYQELRANSRFRIALDESGPIPLELRHHELTTPQGFDPFITTQYREKVEKLAQFRTNWEFGLDPDNERSLDALAVRYFITTESGPQYQRLFTNPSFRLLEPSDSPFKVFEFVKAQPPYGWDPGGDAASVTCARWEPEEREFTVRSAGGGRFFLMEQFFPGWKASVDEKPVLIERWEEAFQAITIPPGEHRVRFIFRSDGLRVGAAVSLASLFVLAFWVRGRISKGESSES